MEYLRKIQEAARQTSPSGISSSTGQAERANGGGGGRNGHAAARSEPPVPGSESHLFSRLYLENMVKSAAAAAAGQSFLLFSTLQSPCVIESVPASVGREREEGRETKSDIDATPILALLMTRHVSARWGHVIL